MGGRLQPSNCKRARKGYWLLVYTFSVKLLVQFENGEQQTLDIKKVEPEEGDFVEPQPGDGVCCNVAGGRYAAVIIECIYDQVCIDAMAIYMI